jgi:hypothetical protein
MSIGRKEGKEHKKFQVDSRVCGAKMEQQHDDKTCW